MLLNPRVSPVTLLTERLVMRLPQLGDAESMAAFFRDNETFLKPYYPTFEQSIFSRNGWQERIRAIHEEYFRGRSLRLSLFLAKGPLEVVGVANFTSIQRDAMQGCNLGYSLAQKFEGQGLMTEALEQAVPYAFRELNLHRIAANYMPGNKRSGAVLERLGFREEGLAKDFLRIDGQWADHVLTARTNPDWAPKK